MRENKIFACKILKMRVKKTAFHLKTSRSLQLSGIFVFAGEAGDFLQNPGAKKNFFLSVRLVQNAGVSRPMRET